MKLRFEHTIVVFLLLLVYVSPKAICDPPELMPGWPFQVIYPNWPYQSDLGPCDGINYLARDSQGETRIVFGLRDSTVHVLDKDCEELEGWPVKGGGYVLSGAAVGDINADGYEEIVLDFCDKQYRRTWIHAYRLDGSDLPGFPLEITRRPGPLGVPTPTTLVLCDLDRNGTLEILFTMCSDSTAYVVNRNGQFMPGWPKNIGPDNFWGNPVSVGDIDGDGYFDIVALSRNHVYVWNSEGLDLPGWPADLPDSLYPSFYSTPPLVDLDGDDNLEILFSTYGPTCFLYGRVYVYHSDGRMMEGWPHTFSNGIPVSTPSVGDVDNDGELEIVVTLNERDLTDNVYILNKHGLVENSWHIEMWSDNDPDPILADVDANGCADIVVTTNMSINPDSAMGAYYAFDKDGNLLDGWPVVVRDLTGDLAATLYDIDGDSSMNMTVGSSGLRNHHGLTATFHAWLYDLHVPINPELMFWPMFAHDQYHTSNFHFKVPPLTQVEGAGASIPFGFRLYQNYPNPFNEETTIRFNLPKGEAGEVILQVFDIQGRLVKRESQVVQRYVPGNGPAGYTFSWDGTDRTGQAVSSGIYFYRLRFRDHLLVRKMTLLR